MCLISFVGSSNKRKKIVSLVTGQQSEAEQTDGKKSFMQQANATQILMLNVNYQSCLTSRCWNRASDIGIWLFANAFEMCADDGSVHYWILSLREEKIQ